MNNNQTEYQKLEAELNHISNMENPLDYKSNNAHYSYKFKYSIAEYVSQVGEASFWLGIALKYVLRRHKKGQYQQDVIKILHCIKLAQAELISKISTLESPTRLKFGKAKPDVIARFSPASTALLCLAEEVYQTEYADKVVKATGEIILGMNEFINTFIHCNLPPISGNANMLATHLKGRIDRIRTCILIEAMDIMN